MNYEQKYKKALCRAKTFYKRWIAWFEKQKDACDREYVFRPLAGDTIEKAAEKAVELDGKVVLAFNGAYIPVDNKTKDEIVAEYHDWVKKQCGRAKLPDSSYTTDKSVIEFADEYSHNVWEKLMANFNNIDGYSIGCNDVSDIVLNAIIDTCNWNKPMTREVKDLEDLFQALPESIVDEKSHQVYELCVYHYDGQCVVDYLGEIYHDSLYTFVGDTLYDAIEKAWNWLRKNSTGG